MGVGKSSLVVLVLLTMLPFSFAAVTYTLVTELSNTDTVSHGGEHKVSYNIKNTNNFCKVICNAKMESNYYTTLTSGFTTNAGAISPRQFILHSPSKKESNYEPYGDVKYTLDIKCTTIESIIPICFAGIEDLTASTADSKTFTLNYGLSSSEQQAKSEYEALVSSVQQDIQSLNNRGNELKSFYDNLVGNVLIPSETQQEVNRLSNTGNDAFKTFEESHDDYKVLNVNRALSILSQYKTTNFDALLSDVASTQNKLTELQKRHDEIVQRIGSIQKKLSDNSEEIQRAGLSTQYFNLVNTYESLQNSLNNLQFSSYTIIESEVLQLENDFDNLIELKKQEEEKVIGKLNEAYLTETTKINAPIQLLGKSTLTLTINQFCSDFKTSIPQQFGTYNDDQQEKIDQQNQRNKEYNTFLESIRTSWSELVQLIKDIINTSEGNIFDASLINGCDVTPALDSDFQQEDVGNILSKCRSYQVTLKQSIQNNQKITSRFLNFFKYIFVDKPKLNQTIVPELDTFIRPTGLVYKPVEFDEQTNTLISEYCSFNPKNVILKSPKEVLGIGYDASSEAIEFANIRGNCEVLDCYNNRDTFPVLFVHGHMFTDSKDPMVDSRYTFDNMIDYLSNQNDKAFDAGTIVDKGNEFLDSGLKTNAGVALFRTTYYGYAYIDSLGKFQFEKRNYESIGEYANKLKSIIDATLETTGRSKVKIVSHSMGGLVVREYLRNYGSSKVDTFIMIGTPNDGTTGDVRDLCDDFGANTN